MRRRTSTQSEMARRVFRVIIRAGLHFGAARDASTLLLPYQNDVSKVSVRLADSLRQPGALARLKMHQRHMALRSLEGPWANYGPRSGIT